MSALLGSRSSEEGVARDSSLALSLSLSLPCPPPLVFLPAQPPSHSISTCPELQIQPSHHSQMGTKLQPAVSLPGSGENIAWMSNYKHGLYVFSLCCFGGLVLFYFIGTFVSRVSFWWFLSCLFVSLRLTGGVQHCVCLSVVPCEILNLLVQADILERLFMEKGVRKGDWWLGLGQ